MCGAVHVATGTSTPTQTPGDCWKNVCDGQGNVVVVVDDSDAPGNDGNCSVGSCFGGVLMSSQTAVGSTCNQGGGHVCDYYGSCVQCLSGASCASGVCTGGVCATSACNDFIQNVNETDVDCGGPSCQPCVNGKTCAANADCISGICSGGVCVVSLSTCPSLPPSGPTTSWADCSVGVDPTHSGGDLVWAHGSWLLDLMFSSCYLPAGPPLLQFILGPTGDAAVSTWCNGAQADYYEAARFNGSGAPGIGVHHTAYSPGNSWGSIAFDRYDNLVTDQSMAHTWIDESLGAVGGSNGGFGWAYTSASAQQQPFGQWDSDALGNAFLVLDVDHSVTIGSVLLPIVLSLGERTFLVRQSATSTSYLAEFVGSFAADQTGGVYRTGPLGTDVGCGPVNSPIPGFYFARLDASWACVHARALPANASYLVDPTGGAVLSASSSSALDLGCGPLPAAPGGSTFVTRIDAAGACVFGASLAVPGLHVLLAPGGGLVVSGFVGAVTVDLGGGPLAPLGVQDFVIGELDVAGHHVWSRRLGGPGITFTSPKVSTSAAGDVYLLTGWSGTADLGGGGVTVATGDLAVGSFSPSGAHRWSRGFHLAGNYQAGIDGCGSLVVASADPAFDPGCGQVVSTPWPYPGSVSPRALHVALARFAP